MSGTSIIAQFSMSLCLFSIGLSKLPYKASLSHCYYSNVLAFMQAYANGIQLTQFV